MNGSLQQLVSGTKSGHALDRLLPFGLTKDLWEAGEGTEGPSTFLEEHMKLAERNPVISHNEDASIS